MTTRLYSLRDVSRELGLPESTVRYYRDGFEEYLPVVGQGRRRRYPAEALPLFRLIADRFAANRSRYEIAAALAEAGGTVIEEEVSTEPVPVAGPLVGAPLPGGSYDQLLATVLDGERERREVMWQLAREIVRLGEAVERQQVVLSEIARRADSNGHRTLPPPADPAGASEAAASDEAPDVTAGLEDELQTLRRELEQERELVDRLRKSKLDIERRAALAEAALRTGPDADAPAPPRPGMFRRVRRRDDDERS